MSCIFRERPGVRPVDRRRGGVTLLTEAKKPKFGQAAAVSYAHAGPPSLKYSLPATSWMPRLSGGEELPNDAIECNSRGNAWLLANRPQDALRAYDRAIALSPDYVDPHFNRGNALLRLQRFDEALEAYDRTIELSPSLVLAHYNRATVLQALRRVPEALEGYRSVLAMDPGHVEARFNLGSWFLENQQLEQAFAFFDPLAKQAPQVPEVHHNLGTTLLRLGRYAEAVLCFDRALDLRPQYAEALNNRGEANCQMRQWNLAMADLQRAVRLRPNQAATRFLLGRIWREMKRYDLALEQFYEARRLLAHNPLLTCGIIAAKMHSCKWDGLDSESSQLQRALDSGTPAVEPFVALSLWDDPALHKTAAQLQIRNYLLAASNSLGAFNGSRKVGKIRVGYYSADFRNHPVAQLIVELLELHDRDNFEWYGLYVGPEVHDPLRVRVEAALDHFLDVRERSDREIAQLSRDLGIDIAVDLMGFTQDSRLGCFAYRCAPVQVSYLGYPGTTGATYMDYVVADRVVIPPEAEEYFTEKVVYMPHSYQANDSRPFIAKRVFAREELGLPSTGFVFCCFNNNFKILPLTFDGWMRILRSVEGSVLWLLGDDPVVSANLRQQAAMRGVAPDRLIFASRMPLDQHLARHRSADLFLDTFPYNAHTTASDALRAGLPLLTCMGKSFASRVAASLLHAVGLPELVTSTPEAFEARAIELAHDPAQLAGLRERLRNQGSQSHLFDTPGFARDIESAFMTMHDRQQKGLPPQVIEVS